MALDYGTLDLLRQNHPAWRLLRAQPAPLVACLLQWVFVGSESRLLTLFELLRQATLPRIILRRI